MIRLSGISKSYGKNGVLNHISGRIDDGDFLVLRGESGSGKSTLLKILGCLLRPDEGKLLYNGENLIGLNEQQRARWRKEKTGFVFQRFKLIPYLNAWENVSYPMLYNGMGRAQAQERAMKLLDMVGLSGQARQYPAELSGGQAQRTAIARSLANRPEVLLCDEPTGSLDPGSARKVMEILKVVHQCGKTIIMVTHDEKMEKYGTRIWHIREGSVYER